MLNFMIREAGKCIKQAQIRGSVPHPGRYICGGGTGLPQVRSLLVPGESFPYPKPCPPKPRSGN